MSPAKNATTAPVCHDSGLPTYTWRRAGRENLSSHPSGEGLARPDLQAERGSGEAGPSSSPLSPLPLLGKVTLPYGISVGARIPTEKATAALKVCIFIKSLDMILTNDFPKITGFPSLWRSLPPYVRTGPSLGSQSQNAWCRHPGQKLYWTVADIPKAVLCTNLRQAHTKNTHTIIRRH